MNLSNCVAMSIPIKIHFYLRYLYLIEKIFRRNAVELSLKIYTKRLSCLKLLKMLKSVSVRQKKSIFILGKVFSVLNIP